MSLFNQGFQLRTLRLGTQVLKGPLVLPATTTSTLFTVSGGAVLITSLLGLCTTVCTATATTLSVGTAPTTGTASHTGLSTATAITSSEVGTWVGLGATAGAALIVGGANGAGASAGFGQLAGPPAPLAVSAGTITLTTSATNTGAFSWYLAYIPLDTGASVS
jgi:hypothetical protein